jgi:hypothetical protein
MSDLIEIDALLPYVRIFAILTGLFLLEEIVRKYLQFRKRAQKRSEETSTLEIEESELNWGRLKDLEDLSGRDRTKRNEETADQTEESRTATLTPGQ